MTANILEKMFEHNNWANLLIVQACAGLSNEQLDGEPKSATKGSIRDTLTHLVTSQRGYLRLLTRPLEDRQQRIPAPPFEDLEKVLNASGAALLAIARDASSLLKMGRLQTTDGYFAEPWVVMLQIINHATEHREQIKSMLSALGLTPPNIDGWDYAEAAGGLIPVEKPSGG